MYIYISGRDFYSGIHEMELIFLVIIVFAEDLCVYLIPPSILMSLCIHVCKVVYRHSLACMHISMCFCACLYSLYVICDSSSGADSGSTCWEEGSRGQEGDPERYGS